MRLPLRGFSLVELAIVLVILGLLVGGILSGRSLIRASELRSISTQYQHYYTAIKTFRDKYFALPGDMTNATSFWGLLSANPHICTYTGSTDTSTCDGNGNNEIDPMGPSYLRYESARAWQHLANAGLIEGRYVGTFTTPWVYPFENQLPRGKIAKNYWSMVAFPHLNNYSNYFDGPYGNSLFYAGFANGSNQPLGTNLSAMDVWNIDSKMDDGKPAVGKVVVAGGSGTAGLSDCTTAVATNTLTAEYLLTGTSTACGIVFRQQF
jgi:prepilin-type N-terminal cleavage/methylation domain-containing protein